MVGTFFGQLAEEFLARGWHESLIVMSRAEEDDCARVEEEVRVR